MVEALCAGLHLLLDPPTDVYPVSAPVQDAPVAGGRHRLRER
ncbi:hypothetical protein [Nocardia sp. XZ_19_385]|nr:hypothetical protein [Nocardia sp. XZ_19_385]